MSTGILVRSVPKTFTIGYAGRTLAEFIRSLRSQHVQRVIDVRALPISRKPGFSKSKLRDALAAAGIDYVHLRDAGNPYRHMAADVEKCLKMYARHLDDSPEAVLAVRTAATGVRSALLCVEADPACCHRSVLASRLGARSKVEHL